MQRVGRNLGVGLLCLSLSMSTAKAAAETPPAAWDEVWLHGRKLFDVGKFREAAEYFEAALGRVQKDARSVDTMTRSATLAVRAWLCDQKADPELLNESGAHPSRIRADALAASWAVNLHSLPEKCPASTEPRRAPPSPSPPVQPVLVSVDGTGGPTTATTRPSAESESGPAAEPGPVATQIGADRQAATVKMKRAGYGLLPIGVTTAVLAAVPFVLAKRASEELVACSANPTSGCIDEWDTVVRRGRSLDRATSGLLGAGISVASVGAVLLITGLVRERRAGKVKIGANGGGFVLSF